MARSKKSTDARLNRDEGTSRRDRQATDRPVTQNRELTDEQRLDEFRKSFFQSVLPDMPEIPGFHVCWLTTTNPRDSIAARVRLGYTPVTTTDVPGWEYATIKTGEYAGCIGVNEMLAFKLPLHLFEAYMYEAHHASPRSEEQKLSSVVEVIRERAARSAKSGSRGVRIEATEDMAELGKDREPPSFTRTLTNRQAPRRGTLEENQENW